MTFRIILWTASYSDVRVEQDRYSHHIRDLSVLSRAGLSTIAWHEGLTDPEHGWGGSTEEKWGNSCNPEYGCCIRHWQDITRVPITQTLILNWQLIIILAIIVLVMILYLHVLSNLNTFLWIALQNNFIDIIFYHYKYHFLIYYYHYFHYNL